MRIAIIGIGGVAVVMGGVFLLFPQIDLVVTAAFFTGGSERFLLLNDPWVEGVRRFFQGGFTLLCGVVLLAFLVHTSSQRTLLGLDGRQSAYLLACFALGPGLLVNGILKTYWGRARPLDILEFGGERMFTPPLLLSDQCSYNCSFVSGEASMGFSLLAVALLTAKPRRPVYIGLSLALGSFIGFLRIAMGKHFLSDVVFAGLLTALLTLVLYRLIIKPAS